MRCTLEVDDEPIDSLMILNEIGGRKWIEMDSLVGTVPGECIVPLMQRISECAFGGLFAMPSGALAIRHCQLLESLSDEALADMFGWFSRITHDVRLSAELVVSESAFERQGNQGDPVAPR